MRQPALQYSDSTKTAKKRQKEGGVKSMAIEATRMYTPEEAAKMCIRDSLYAAGKPIFRQRRTVRRAGAPALRAAVPRARRTAISGAGNPVHAVSGVTVLFRRCAGTAPRFILILERS